MKTNSTFGFRYKIFLLGIFLFANQFLMAQSGPKIEDKVITIQQWSHFDKSDMLKEINVIDSLFTPDDFRNETNGCKLKFIDSINVHTEDPGIYTVCLVAINGNQDQSDMKCLIIKVASNTTSVNALNFESKIVIFPNPSNGELTVNFNTPLTENLKINITNILGETIATYTHLEIVGNSLNLHLENQNAGFYFISIEDNNQVTTKKISITK